MNISLQPGREKNPTDWLFTAWFLVLAALVVTPAFWMVSHYLAWGVLWGCYLAGTAPEPPPPIEFLALWRPV